MTILNSLFRHLKRQPPSLELIALRQRVLRICEEVEHNPPRLINQSTAAITKSKNGQLVSLASNFIKECLYCFDPLYADQCVTNAFINHVQLLQNEFELLHDDPDGVGIRTLINILNDLKPPSSELII